MKALAAAAHGAVWPPAQTRSSARFGKKAWLRQPKNMQKERKKNPPQKSLTAKVHGRLMGQEVAQRRRTVERKCGYSGKLSSVLARCQAAGQRRISLLRRPLTTSSSRRTPYSALIKYSFSKTWHLCNKCNKPERLRAGQRGRKVKKKNNYLRSSGPRVSGGRR